MPHYHITTGISYPHYVPVESLVTTSNHLLFKRLLSKLVANYVNYFKWSHSLCRIRLSSHTSRYQSSHTHCNHTHPIPKSVQSCARLIARLSSRLPWLANTHTDTAANGKKDSSSLVATATTTSAAFLIVLLPLPSAFPRCVICSLFPRCVQFFREKREKLLTEKDLSPSLSSRSISSFPLSHCSDNSPSFTSSLRDL